MKAVLEEPTKILMKYSVVVENLKPYVDLMKAVVLVDNLIKYFVEDLKRYVKLKKTVLMVDNMMKYSVEDRKPYVKLI